MTLFNFEKATWAEFKLQYGDVFLDVGANIGWYSLNAAKIVGNEGEVLAFEPETENYLLLKENIRLNNFKNVAAFNLAAWNENGELNLILSSDSTLHTLNENFARQRSASYYSNQHTLKCTTRRLDDVLKDYHLKHLDWVKIDVEGAEIEVLEGLSKTLQETRPIIIIESYRLNELECFMEMIGYSVMRIPDQGATNYICHPVG